MSRLFVALSAAALVSLAACSGPEGTMTAGAGATDIPVNAAAMGRAGALPGEIGTGPIMSSAAARVSQIAARNGDRDYLIVDKVAGEIILFRNGVPVVRGSALTGANPGDTLAPGSLERAFTRAPRFEDKITPAGRYTVGEAPDHLFGVTLNVNEIQGSDWDIAIHKIFLGFPLEHRDTRLASMNGRDKHITFGCIDVSAPVMRRILAEVPNEDGTPVYIVPTDERRIEAFFPPLSPGAKVAAAGD